MSFLPARGDQLVRQPAGAGGVVRGLPASGGDGGICGGAAAHFVPAAGGVGVRTCGFGGAFCHWVARDGPRACEAERRGGGGGRRDDRFGADASFASGGVRAAAGGGRGGRAAGAGEEVWRNEYACSN